jgi:hypothetical protein
MGEIHPNLLEQLRFSASLTHKEISFTFDNEWIFVCILATYLTDLFEFDIGDFHQTFNQLFSNDAQFKATDYISTYLVNSFTCFFIGIQNGGLPLNVAKCRGHRVPSYGKQYPTDFVIRHKAIVLRA